jgi:phage terminase large subunit-like protein
VVNVFVLRSQVRRTRILFEYAHTYAERLNGEIVIRHLELRVPGGHLRVLASDAPKVHGLTYSLAIVDELHAHADDELYLALRTAMLKRPDARMAPSPRRVRASRIRSADSVPVRSPSRRSHGRVR